MARVTKHEEILLDVAARESQTVRNALATIRVKAKESLCKSA
jgi:hypothetical protein